MLVNFSDRANKLNEQTQKFEVDAIVSDIGDESIRLVIRYYDCNHVLLYNRVW
ncbi:MAG: hypothetical protein IJ791_07450 [Lachnospiraceae bacterium]|nr:hypothetical protein [Lachnospiraceae bacterium]